MRCFRKEVKKFEKNICCCNGDRVNNRNAIQTKNFCETHRFISTHCQNFVLIELSVAELGGGWGTQTPMCGYQSPWTCESQMKVSLILYQDHQSPTRTITYESYVLSLMFLISTRNNFLCKFCRPQLHIVKTSANRGKNILSFLRLLRRLF